MDRQEKKAQIKKLQEEVSALAVEELEKAKKDGKPFDQIFELWLDEEVPKKDYDYMIHIQVGKHVDIWDFIGYGDPIRGMKYMIEDIIICLEEYTNYSENKNKKYIDKNINTPILNIIKHGNYVKKLTKEELIEIKKELMRKNVGSTTFDW